MRFYPFGSSSLNQIYNTELVTSASLANYAASASYGIRVVSASYTLTGVAGTTGLTGTCSYPPGPDGDIGNTGAIGPNGGVSVPLAGSV